jgi:uncharacterized protein (DUF952 family)
MDVKHIYRICTEADWQRQCESPGTEGGRPAVFLTADQVRGAFAREWAGKKGLVLLRGDVDRFGDRLRWEAGGDQRFPTLPGGQRPGDFFVVCVGHLPENQEG